MQSSTFYKYIIGLLILLNISIITFFIVHKPHPPRNGHHNQFEREAVRILGLNETQKAIFLKAAYQHGQEMRQFHKTHRNLLQTYFQMIKDQNDTIKIKTLENKMNKIQELERKKIEVTYQHFETVKALLKTEQQANFEFFMEKALRVILLE